MTNEQSKGLLRNCKLTSSNYGNLANQLQKRKNVFQILLPYYSIIGIINGLIPRFFTLCAYQKDVLAFWGICVSVTFLVISMQIALARYPERIESANNKLNSIKSLINHIESDQQIENISDFWKEYNALISNSSFIQRRYFYKTCTITDKKSSNTQNKETASHFSKIESICFILVEFFENMFFIILFLLPFIIYIIVFLSFE